MALFLNEAFLQYVLMCWSFVHKNLEYSKQCVVDAGQPVCRIMF